MKMNPVDIPNYRQYMLLIMKRAVPKPLTDQEKIRLEELRQTLFAKYGNLDNRAVNFITGEITEKLF